MNFPTHNRVFGYLFLLLAPIMVGINIVGAKYLVPSTPILFLITIRFLLATILLLPLHWLTPIPNRLSITGYVTRLNKRDWIFIVAQAISAGVLFNFLMVYGLRHTDANTAGIITSGLPAIIAIMSWLFLKEYFTLKKIICVGFATFGLIVVNLHQTHYINTNQGLFGNLIVLLSLIPEACYYILTKIHTSSLPVFLLSSLLNGINAILLLPIMLCTINWHTLSLPVFHWFILMVIGISSGLFYVCWYLGSKDVDPVMAALSTAIMPLATVSIAWLTLGEKIGMVPCLGIGLVMISIIAYALPPFKKNDVQSSVVYSNE